MMNRPANIYSSKLRWKVILLLAACMIGIASLWYTNQLVVQLSAEERAKVELWAEATRQLADPENTSQDLGFLLQVIQNNTTVPVILIDSTGNVISHRNLDSIRVSRPGYLEEEVESMRSRSEPISIELGEGDVNYIYYTDSILLTKLFYYPYIQLGVIVLFMLVAYFAFSASRNAEQNKVWVGLSKETAHQLGTPTSSLMAWVEILRDKVDDTKLMEELEKDVAQLGKVADRFSKIGSKPVLVPEDLVHVVQISMQYMKTRAPGDVIFDFLHPGKPVIVPLNAPLFQWVIENLCKNALDAMEGKGKIQVTIKEGVRSVQIDVSDTGKGIAKKNFKTVFKPGYTTKKRGWGLGLSLTKRIIESYHEGKIFVAHSEIDKGTTFRLVMRA